MKQNISGHKVRFSIVVPVYNTVKYLRKCLDSVSNQSFHDYEIILVDDGSTDSSGDVCDIYSSKYHNVKVIHKKNQGQIAARLDGVRAASGEYIVFADSDDLLEHKALEVLNSKIEQYNPDGVIYASFRMTTHGLVKLRDQDNFSDYVITDKGELYRKMLESPSYYAMWRKAFKKTMFSFSGFESLYDMRIGEDFFQTMDLISNSTSVLFISDCLYSYRSNPESIIHKERIASKYKTDFTSALYVLDLVKTSPYFSDKDLEEQLFLSLQGITDRLEEISNLKANFQRKIELFEQIKSEPYFIENIQNLKTGNLSGTRKKLYVLFLESNYNKLIRLEKIINIPKKIKHCIAQFL